jgi:hypothetical protein
VSWKSLKHGSEAEPGWRRSGLGQQIIDRWRRRRTGGLVDEVFNRVTWKLEEGEPIDDVPTYCNGVARLVLLQSLERHSYIRNWFSVDGSVRLH